MQPYTIHCKIEIHADLIAENYNINTYKQVLQLVALKGRGAYSYMFV